MRSPSRWHRAGALWLLLSAAWPALAQPSAEQLARGRALFVSQAQPACAVCHTLKAAGAEGQIGPDLDELKPESARVLRVLKSGLGVMPSFANSLSEADMLALAHYVAKASGAATAKSP